MLELGSLANGAWTKHRLFVTSAAHKPIEIPSNPSAHQQSNHPADFYLITEHAVDAFLDQFGYERSEVTHPPTASASSIITPICDTSSPESYCPHRRSRSCGEIGGPSEIRYEATHWGTEESFFMGSLDSRLLRGSSCHGICRSEGVQKLLWNI